jgi:radical SAM superfamily enzyme YgiQ (UPF0313 family)
MAKIHFIQDIFLNESLGIMCLSSYLKANNHQVGLSFLSDGLDTVCREILETNPDIVGFSVMTPQEPEYRRISQIIKDKFGCLIVWGGPHCTFMQNLVAAVDEVDFFCVGEGETVLLSLMNQLDGDRDFSNIPGLWHRKPNRQWVSASVTQLEDLNKYPPPDRELFYSKSQLLRHFSFKRVITGKGCPYKCNYCFQPAWNEMHKGKGQILRRKSVDYVINEIMELTERYPTKLIHFSDDSFNLDRKHWIKQFLPRFKEEIRLPFTANIAIGMVDEELVKDMAEARCRGVTFGLESGNEHLRMNILQKKVTNNQIIRATDLFRKYKLKCMTFNMFGIPTETLSDAIETVQLNRDCGIYSAWPNMLKIYKGTKLAEYALQNDLSEAEGIFTYKSKDPSGDHACMENLMWLTFYFLKIPLLIKLAKPIIKSALTKHFRFLIFFTYWPFIRFYKVSLWDSFRYFLASRKLFMQGIGASQIDEYKEIQHITS